jgi:hypothetical protein
MVYENLCTLPLASDLFCQALHPTEPVLAVGLSAGHVQVFRLPDEENDEEEDGDSDEEGTSVKSAGTSHIETLWRTRRHKGSCRTIGFSGDGEGMLIFSLASGGMGMIVWNDEEFYNAEVSMKTKNKL